ncbi:MAG TPA: molybdate ABC transporter substrate-binding protein [Chloroflexota bacterium]|nr:molybdate ABC transporter substrate-binding protein [Chloroflexota bacterium]
MPNRLRYALVPWVALVALLLSMTGSATHAAAPASSARSSGSLTVFAAASLTEAFTTIGATFDKANGVTTRFNFGGSDTLVTQLSQGAPADVFASANQAQMTIAQGKGLISSTPTVFVRNRLIVIVPKNNPARIYSLADLGRPGVNLVLAAPAVPVGKYARAAFSVMAGDESFGANFLARIQANLKSEEIDVKAVTAKVSLGEADAGVVYVTDVTPSVAAKVQTIEIPLAFNQVASYPIAVTKASQNPTLAQKFIQYVQSAAGKTVLAAHGFITQAPAGGPSTAFTVSGQVTTPTTFSVATLRSLPATTVTATLRTDQGTQGTYSYTGVLLSTILQKVMPVTNPSFKNDALRQFVTIGATDGYQATIGMGEILPQFGHQPVILAYARNGKPLGPDEGAIRLIVPGDNLAGRWVSHVNSIVVGTPVGTPS